MEEIDLRNLWEYFKKSILKFTIIVLAVFSCGTFYTFKLQKPEYQSRTTVILSGDQSRAITQNELTINKNLVETYAEVVKSHRVLDKVKDKLQLDYDYDGLSKKVKVAAIKDTEIIEIIVRDSDSETAKNIADKTAKIFVKEISTLYSIKNANILDRAIAATTPHNVNVLRQELIAFVAGVVIACGVLFLIFYFDRTIKTAEQIEQYIKLPLIGKIRKHKALKAQSKLSVSKTKSNSDQAEKSKDTKDAQSAKTKKSQSDQGSSSKEEIVDDGEIIVRSKPKSRISEDFRTLRTNLHFSLDGKNSKTVLITSTSPSEGKSFITSNLATAFAQSGKKVLLVDCDMRHGRLHEIFSVPNELGLSRLLADHKSARYFNYICRTDITNLSIITRGATPPNPSELLDSPDMETLLTKARAKYDYVILDGTPLDDLSDSVIVAKKAERVILVCSSGDTTIDELTESKKALNNVEANIAGVILNQVSEKKHKNKYNKYYI